MTESDLREWLKTNRRILRDRTSEEVSCMARLVGFPVDVVCKVLSHFQDAVQGSCFENRMAFQMKANLRAIDDRSGKPSLLPQWSALSRKLLYDEDFNDDHR